MIKIPPIWEEGDKLTLVGNVARFAVIFFVDGSRGNEEADPRAGADPSDDDDHGEEVVRKVPRRGAKANSPRADSNPTVLLPDRVPVLLKSKSVDRRGQAA